MFAARQADLCPLPCLIGLTATQAQPQAVAETIDVLNPEV